MLELRPTCECCNRDLPPESTDAMICSFGCTFCRDCVAGVLKGVCPNCGGEFVSRPVVIRPITDCEFAAWLAEVVPAYAADKVASGDWPEASAIERSRMEFESLLPQGKDTPDQHLYSIVGFDGATVGMIWFAVKQEGGKRIGYVYDVTVSPAHQRQGHAWRAFLAVEAQARRLGLAGIGLHVFGHNTGAQALYAKLGYVPTHINLYKPLAAEGVVAPPKGGAP